MTPVGPSQANADTPVSASAKALKVLQLAEGEGDLVSSDRIRKAQQLADRSHPQPQPQPLTLTLTLTVALALALALALAPTLTRALTPTLPSLELQP